MIRSNIYGTTSGISSYGTVSSTGNSTSNTNESSSSDDLRRPKPVFFWTNGEVMKWLKRHCEEFYELYGAIFLENEITGRSLIRINEETLIRMGIDNVEHREQIARIILKLKLKSDMIEIKDFERKATVCNGSSSSQTNTLPKASSQNNNKTFGNFIR